MLDSKALASIPLIPANTAPPAPDYPWPKPYTSAMFLSFDVDAETAWTSKDALHAQRLITMSYGGYEARVGTPKLLELLDRLDLKATFFVVVRLDHAAQRVQRDRVRMRHRRGIRVRKKACRPEHDPRAAQLAR